MAVTTQQDITQYYVVLGLSCGATIEQIKQARNLLAREWHPDRFPSDGEKVQAEEKMKRINLAYAFLKEYQPIEYLNRSTSSNVSAESPVNVKAQSSPSSRNLKDPVALVQEARSMAVSGQVNEAIMLLDVAISTQDDYAEAYQLRGELRQRLGQDYGAKSDLRNARHYRWANQPNAKKEPVRSTPKSTPPQSTPPQSTPPRASKTERPKITFQYEMKGHTDRVTQLRWHNKVLLSASLDGSVRFWSGMNGMIEVCLPGKDAIVSMAVSPAQDLWVTGCQNGQVKMWSFKHRKLIRSLSLHQGSVTGVAFDASGTLLTTVGEDGAMKIFRLNPASLVATVNNKMPIWAIDRLGNHFVTTHSNSKLNINQLDTVLHSADLSSPVCKALGGSRDGKWIAVGDDRACIVIFDSTGNQIKSFATYGTGKVNTIAFTSDSKYLITAGSSSMIQIWNTKTWDLFHQWDAGSTEITALQVSERFIFSAGSDHTIKLWKIEE